MIESGAFFDRERCFRWSKASLLSKKNEEKRVKIGTPTRFWGHNEGKKAAQSPFRSLFPR